MMMENHFEFISLLLIPLPFPKPACQRKGQAGQAGIRIFNQVLKCTDSTEVAISTFLLMVSKNFHLINQKTNCDFL
jgi:hypothetical protein